MLWNKKVEDDNKLPDIPSSGNQIKNTSPSQIVEKSSPEDEHFESIKTSEKNSLPSFPDNPVDKGFSQSAIKEAVSQEDFKIPLPPAAEEEVNFLSNNLKTQSTTSQISSSQNTFIQPNPFLNESIVNERKIEPPVVSKLKIENRPIKMVSIPHDYPEDAPHPPFANKTAKTDIPRTIQNLPKLQEYKKTQDYLDKENYSTPEQIPQKTEEKTSDVFVKIDKFYSAKKALTGIKQNVKDIENLLVKIRETKMKEERELADWEKNISSVKVEISSISDSLFDKTI